MKKVLIIFVFLLQVSVTSSFAQDKAQKLYVKAQALAEQTEYKTAEQTFLDARKEFVKQGNQDKGHLCLLDAREMSRVMLQYPYTEKEMRKLLKESYADVSDQERESWIKQGKVDFLQVGKERFYFEDFVHNVTFRNIPLMQRYNDKKGKSDPFFDEVQEIVFHSPTSGYPAKSWKPFIRPKRFLIESSLVVPREKMPQEGILKLWVPLPIQTAAQFDVRVVSITPEQYIKMPPQLDADIGIAYLEVDMKELKEDLDINVQVIFSRYEERFNIDPANVGRYDRDSYLYKHYTRSQKNIPVNEKFRKKALEIIGDETNSYLAAKKIYYYILNNIRYSFMPHVRLAALDIPEPVFVMENSFGDCGAQSMYFASLCRSVGIPARTSGGMQLIPSVEGDHFWAEFFLPNYGWVPVDTTIAESSDWTDRITDDQRKTYKEFYFGNLDPYRMVIQNDVDVPLNPLPQEKLILSCAIQEPGVVCETCEDDFALTIEESWKVKVNPVFD